MPILGEREFGAIECFAAILISQAIDASGCLEPFFKNQILTTCDKLDHAVRKAKGDESPFRRRWSSPTPYDMPGEIPPS